MTFKLKVRTKLPAFLSVTGPLTLVKNGISYIFGLDINVLRESLDPIYGEGMTGPGIAVDNAVPRFNGTVGNVLQGSNVTIDDTSGLNVPQDFTLTTGRISVGSGGSNNSFYPAFVDDRSITAPGTSLHAFADNKIIDASGDFGMNSFDSRFNVIGSQTYDHIQCFQAFPQFGSTGTIRALTGYTFTPVLSAGGHVQTLIGVAVGNPLGNTAGSIPYVGTIDAAYGIQIADYSTSGTFTRSIQTFGPAISEFGGEVRSRVEFNSSCALPTFRMSSVDPGTGYTTYGSMSHDGGTLTIQNNIAASSIFFNIGNPGVSAFRFAPGAFYIFGTTSGSVKLQVPNIAGSNTITLPAGTTDFSSTGGASQVVKQTSAGGAFTVGQLAISDLSTFTSANLRGALTDETGTGAAVFAGGNIGAATATSINAATVSPGHYSGEPSNGNALAGEIGEYIESILVSGSAVSLTSSTAKTITSISLTAGDWDVDGVVSFLPANTTSVTVFVGSMSLVTNTIDVTPGRVVSPPMGTVVYNGTVGIHTPMPHYRFSLASATTIFLIGYSTFTVSTNVSYGMIRARRIR